MKYTAVAQEVRASYSTVGRLNRPLRTFYLSQNGSYEQTFYGELYKFEWKDTPESPLLFDSWQEAHTRASEWCEGATADSYYTNYVPMAVEYDDERERLKLG